MIALPLEQRMLVDVDVAVDVAARAAVVSRLSLSPQTKLHAVVDSRGNPDLQPRAALFAAGPGTLGAALANNLSRAAAGGTGRLDAEEALGLDDLPAACAVAALFGLRAGLGARAVA